MQLKKSKNYKSKNKFLKMRTKLYLSALCLPLAFAACTNDEFENLANNTPIKGETVNVVLSAARPQLGADTKMTIDSENQFVWEAQKDLLGAALQSTGTSNVTAFPFKADESARVSTFTGTSALPVGSYLFTYPYVDVLDQKVMPLNLPEQTYDPADTKTAIQQAVNYMKMISPMVSLAGVAYADVEEYNLNLQFANLYTLVRVNISAANIPAGVEPTVTKVTLNTTNGGGFVSKASADLTKIAEAGMLELGKDGKLNQEELTAAVAELEELIASGDIYGNAKKEGDGSVVDGTSIVRGASVLKVEDGCKLSATAETSLYILAPKGEYTDLTLTVETSEGTYERKMSFTTEPLALENQIQPISADLDFAQQNGNVVLPASISVASTEDWNDAVNFVLAHATAYLNKTVEFNLTKDIAVDNLPNFNVNITGGKTLTLNKDYTITSNNVGNVSASMVTLGVGANATLTIDALVPGSPDPTFPFAGVKNEGTLVVNVDMPAAITNLGTMNLSKDVELKGGVTNGQIAVPATGTPKVAGTINILDGETTISTKALSNLVGDVKIAKGATLTISFVSENKGTITNEGDLEGTGAITNKGVIDNFGTLACAITNTDGQVIAEKGGLSNNTSTITGGELLVMDVTDFAAIKAAEAYKVGGSDGIVSTEINNAKEYTTAIRVTAINNVILNGGEWTVKDATGADNTKDIKVPTTIEGVNITLKAAALVVNNVTSWKANITAGSGVCSISTDEVSIIIPGSVTVNEGATLNVTNAVSVNTGTTSGVGAYEATINGTLNVNAGAAMYFNEATVGQKGALNVAGSANNNVAAGIFGTNTSFVNSGVVSSLQHTVTDTSATKEAGKVSQPTNTATGTFNGNATIDLVTT